MRTEMTPQFLNGRRKVAKFSTALKKVGAAATQKVKEVALAKPAALLLPKGSGGRRPSKAKLKK
jgi:hypothetical protein